MASIAERLALLITANPDDAIRGLNKLERTADRAVGATNSRMDDLGHSLTRVGAGMLSVGVLGGVGLARAARSTSDLNEAVSLTEAIFGDAADEIGEFSKGAASSIGQSERAAREATATFGGLLDNLGFAQTETVEWSKDLTVLASDLGSAFNTDPADAVLALGSALRGESEPIRRYNVMLDDATVRARAVEMGLAATSAEVDNHGKVQARLALIMEQTNSVQGNFADTSDGMANAQRTFNAQLENFQAALGQGVLPAMESVLGKGTDLLEWFNELDPATQGAITSLATWGTGLLLAGGALSTVVGQAIKMRNNLKLLSAAVKANAAAIGAAAAVAVVAAIAYREYARKQQQAENRVANMTLALQSHNSELDAVSAFVDNARDDYDGLSTAMDNAGVSTADLAAAVIEGGPALAEMTDRLEGSARAAGASETEIWAVGEAVRVTGDAYKDAQVKIEQTNRLTGETGEAADEAIDPMAELSDELDNAADAAADLSSEWRDLVNQLLGGLQAETDAALLVEDISAALEDLDGKTTTEVQAEVLDFVAKLGEIKGAAADAGVDVSSMSDVAEQGLIELMTQAGLSDGAVRTVIASLNALDGLEANASVNVGYNSNFSEAFRGIPTGFAPPSGVGTGGGTYGGLTTAEWERLEVNLNVDGTQIDTVITDIKRRNGGI